MLAAEEQRPRADAEKSALLTILWARRLRRATLYHREAWIAWLAVQFCNAAWSQRTIESEPYLHTGAKTLAGYEKGIGRKKPKRVFSPEEISRARALNDVPHKGRGKAEEAVAEELKTKLRTLQRLRQRLNQGL